MRVAIYVRKSSDNEAGVERQVAIATDFITARGWTMDAAHVYADNDISGGVFDRPGLNALMLALLTKPRPFDALVMMDASRLGREQSETLSLQVRITKAGVRIFHYQDNVELKVGTATEKLMAQIPNFGHEHFKEQISLKTTDALRKKHEQGHATGSRLLGYRNVSQGVGLGKSGRDSHTHVLLEKDPEQASLVQRIFQMAADGKGCHSIAVALTAEQIPPPGAGSGWRKRSKTPAAWSVSTIRKVLVCETYRGRVIRRGSQTIEAPHLRIIEESLWTKVRNRLAWARDHFAGHRASEGTLTGRPEVVAVGKRLLSGLLRCAVCDSSMVAVVRHNKGGGVRSYWACNRSYKQTSGCSVKKVVPNGKLEDAILSHFEGLTPRFIESLLKEELARLLVEDSQKVSARGRLEVEIARLDGELARLAEAIATGGQFKALVEAMATRQRERVEASTWLEHLHGLGQDDLDGAQWMERMRPLTQLQLADNLKDALSRVPSSGRQMLQSILAAPIRLTWDGEFWTYDSEVHLGRLLGAKWPGPMRFSGDMANKQCPEPTRVTSGPSSSGGGALVNRPVSPVLRLKLQGRIAA